jgi:hypothetical protein
MPMIPPVSPAYRAHPKVEACSTQTLAVTVGEITLSVIAGSVLDFACWGKGPLVRLANFLGSVPSDDGAE